MALNQTQRRILEDALTKADRGPSFGIPSVMSAEEAEQRARLWSETWIAPAIRDVLDDVSARELQQRYCL